MKDIGLTFSKVIHKIKFNFKNILIVYVIIFFLWNLPTFISKLNINKAYVLLNTIGFVLIAVFCVCIIILIIFKMSDKIAYFIKQIKIYGISFKPFQVWDYQGVFIIYIKILKFFMMLGQISIQERIYMGIYRCK